MVVAEPALASHLAAVGVPAERRAEAARAIQGELFAIDEMSKDGFVYPSSPEAEAAKPFALATRFRALEAGGAFIVTLDRKCKLTGVSKMTPDELARPDAGREMLRRVQRVKEACCWMIVVGDAGIDLDRFARRSSGGMDARIGKPLVDVFLRDESGKFYSTRRQGVLRFDEYTGFEGATYNEMRRLGLTRDTVERYVAEHPAPQMEDAGGARVRSRALIAEAIGLEVGANLSTPEEADKFIRFIAEIPAEEPPKQLVAGTPKAAFDWFESHMAGRTFIVNGKPFHVNPGHFFRFTCEEPADKSVRKGHVAKATSAEDAMAKIRNGEIGSSDIAGYVEARGRSLPFVERVLENWDAIVGSGRKFRLVKKFQTNRREVDIVVFQHNPDGVTVGPITSHMRAITRGFLEGNSLLAIGDEEAALNRTENSASERASAENNAGTLSRPT